MTRPILEVVDNELKHTNEELELLKAEIEELKKWKNSCTKWAAWWAGVCAAVMTIAAILQTYWDRIMLMLHHGVK